MRLINFTKLVDNGHFTETATFAHIEHDLRSAIDHVRWPPDGPDFAIYPESGKKRGEGNGVKPIKSGFQTLLVQRGWRLEQRQPRRQEGAEVRPGAFDAWLDLENEGYAPFVAEWETGNVSSSHRALNKISMGLLNGGLSGGVLVLPTRRLYRYLTDRTGSYEEITPYFDFWSSIPVHGFLGVISVEHDRESWDVSRIPKGTDGRAIG